MTNSSSFDACAETRKVNPSAACAAAAVPSAASAWSHVAGACRPSPAAKQRLPQPVLALDPVVLEAADVAHPVAVDVVVQARRHAHEPRPLRPLRLRLDPRGRVAALRAERADRVHRVRVVPRPRLEPVVARGDRADRAHVHQVARQERVDAFFLERRDLAAAAPIHDADLRVAVDLFHEPHAPRAQDAPVAVQHQRGPEVHVGLDALAIEHAARKLHPALTGAEAVGEVLQRALAALVADGAVERMVDEQELEHAGARFDDVGRLRHDAHPVGAHRRARRLQLRHLLDLDDADAAGAVDAERGVVAVIRNGEPVLDGRLQDRLALCRR